MTIKGKNVLKTQKCIKISMRKHFQYEKSNLEETSTKINPKKCLFLNLTQLANCLSILFVTVMILI